MTMEVLSDINGLEEKLSLIHMAAFSEGSGWKINDFKELLAISFHYIVIDYDIENKIRGFLAYSVIVDEAEILTFCVDPSNQKKGVGNAIMNYFLEAIQLKHVKIAYLEVAEDNLTAINLYNQFGFSVNGRRLKYYNNRVDALLMKKIL